MTTEFEPEFEPATEYPHDIDASKGIDLAGEPSLYTPECLELTHGLYARIKVTYPDTLSTLKMVQYVKTPEKDRSGNDIFASVVYDAQGHVAVWAGHSEPVGDAGEGHAIVWQCYMD